MKIRYADWTDRARSKLGLQVTARSVGSLVEKSSAIGLNRYVVGTQIGIYPHMLATKGNCYLPSVVAYSHVPGDMTPVVKYVMDSCKIKERMDEKGGKRGDLGGKREILVNGKTFILTKQPWDEFGKDYLQQCIIELADEIDRLAHPANAVIEREFFR